MVSKPYEGYAFIDHRASPGLDEATARLNHYDPAHVREGKVFEAKIQACCHCGVPQIMNPERTRERGSCPRCLGSPMGNYLCDPCMAATRLPDYEHVSFRQKLDLFVDRREKGQPLGTNFQLLKP